MLKAIIFDFDGTILDTETPDFQCWQSIFSDHGSELEQEIWCQVVGTTWDHFNPFDYLEEKIGRRVNRDDLHKLHREKFHEMIVAQAPLPGVESALMSARELGLKLAVASSSPRYWVEGHLDRLGLLKHFEALKTADDVTDVKPDPALYTQALEALGVKSTEAIAFEDSVNGVKAAKAAGIYCIAIPNSVTQNLDFQHADCTMESFAECDIGNLLEKHSAASGSISSSVS